MAAIAAFGALNKHVLKPAVEEIVALAPFNVAATPEKTGRRVSHVRLAWWPKEEDELRAAWAEAQRSRVGRARAHRRRRAALGPITRRYIGWAARCASPRAATRRPDVIED